MDGMSIFDQQQKFELIQVEREPALNNKEINLVDFMEGLSITHLPELEGVNFHHFEFDENPRLMISSDPDNRRWLRARFPPDCDSYIAQCYDDFAYKQDGHWDSLGRQRERAMATYYDRCERTISSRPYLAQLFGFEDKDDSHSRRLFLRLLRHNAHGGENIQDLDNLMLKKTLRHIHEPGIKETLLKRTPKPALIRKYFEQPQSFFGSEPQEMNQFWSRGIKASLVCGRSLMTYDDYYKLLRVSLWAKENKHTFDEYNLPFVSERYGKKVSGFLSWAAEQKHKGSVIPDEYLDVLWELYESAHNLATHGIMHDLAFTVNEREIGADFEDDNNDSPELDDGEGDVDLGDGYQDDGEDNQHINFYTDNDDQTGGRTSELINEFVRIVGPDEVIHFIGEMDGHGTEYVRYGELVNMLSVGKTVSSIAKTLSVDPEAIRFWLNQLHVQIPKKLDR